jgi:hypothetical protein
MVSCYPIIQRLIWNALPPHSHPTLMRPSQAPPAPLIDPLLLAREEAAFIRGIHFFKHLLTLCMHRDPCANVVESTFESGCMNKDWSQTASCTSLLWILSHSSIHRKNCSLQGLVFVAYPFSLFGPMTTTLFGRDTIPLDYTQRNVLYCGAGGGGLRNSFINSLRRSQGAEPSGESGPSIKINSNKLEVGNSTKVMS